MCMSFCALSTAVIASPSAAFRARLNDTVIAGNWPWCVTASGAAVLTNWQKVFSGTALLMAELVAPAELAPLLDVAVDALAESASGGGASVFAEGVYSAEVVSALEPAAAEPDAANEEEAAVPLWPDEEFD